MRPFSGNVDAGEKIRAPGRARIRCARPVRSLLTASLIGRVVCVYRTSTSVTLRRPWCWDAGQPPRATILVWRAVLESRRRVTQFDAARRDRWSVPVLLRGGGGSVVSGG
jgi:hypothetical protein